MKLYKLTLGVWGVLFACVALVGCKKPEPKIRIGVSQCSADDWRSKMNREIELEAKLSDDMEVEIRSANDSNARQIADLRYFASHGFDAIIVAPNEAKAITPIIDSIMGLGIPVVVFDRDVTGRNYTAFQGADNDSIGMQAAKYIHSRLEEDARILEIWGNPESTPARGRHDGFMRGVEQFGNMTVSASAIADWNNDKAYAAADSLLALHPDINVIYAHNDRMAIAAGESARKRGVNALLVGIDADPQIGMKAVSQGNLDATFLYPTAGDQLVRTARAIVLGQPYNKITSLAVASPVDKSNADILLLQNESLLEETAKINRLKTQVDKYWGAHATQTALLYAALIILFLVLTLLALFLRAYWQNKRQQTALAEKNSELEAERDAQKRLNDQLEAATKSKLLFFTNVSHDLRTPLTLVAEPVRQLTGASNLTPRQMRLVAIANKNIHILQRLINQVLDFRKYENGKLELHLTEVDIASLAEDWTEAFESVARKRHIRLSIAFPQGKPQHMALDVEKMERIYFNLLSNALKYTPDNGEVEVTMAETDSQLVLKVKDNGRGISKDDLGNIFDRFFQVDKIHPNGSGIGLSLTKSFVELHDGSITAESEKGRGSEFTVTIPVRHVDSEPVTVVERSISQEDINTELSRVDNMDFFATEETSTGEMAKDDNRPIVLAIDDNNDILMLLSTLLSDNYRVITAHNGADGLRMANKYVPDLVISDVMMPGMDGLEVCRRLKDEISTSHIPVLMLTACSMDEQRIQGYESGADGYVAKPFNNEVLLSRCENLIANRRRIIDLYQGSMPVITEEVKPAEKTPRKSSEKAPALPKAGQLDNEFYRKFVDAFRTRMHDPELGVDSLASELGLGRSQFYRKIKALTNFSPVELMRDLRLREARHRILASDQSVSEIAYNVGFSTPAYFTKCYRQAFGETPTETRSKIGR